MKIENLADWDRAPARDILACLLLKDRAFLQGDDGLPRELDAMAAAGLIEHRLAEEGDLTEEPPFTRASPIWIVRATTLGRIAGIRLAHSVELLRTVITFAKLLFAGYDWEGAAPDEMIAELDVRDGGTGEVDDPGRWLELRGREHVGALARRGGLDGRDSGQGVSCHAS